MNKRGVSTLIAVVLLILITVAAVGIVWQIVIPLAKQSTETTEKCQAASLEINKKSFYNASSGQASILISRGAPVIGTEAAELMAIQIKVTSDTGDSKTVMINASQTALPKINEDKLYVINLGGLTGSSFKVEVAPVVEVNEKDRLCQMTKEHTLNYIGTPQTCLFTCCADNEECIGTDHGSTSDCLTKCCDGTCCIDFDGDGHSDESCGGADCNDTNRDINPDVSEICGNGIDEDCVAGNDACSACSEGAIPSTGCDCGGTNYYSDYCCLGVYQQNPCAVAPADIIFDSSNSTTGSGSSVSWSHTVGSGSNRILIVGSATEYNTVYNIVNVTYGNQNFTKAVAHNVGSTYWMTTEIWYLLNPATGTNTIQVDYDGSTESTVVGSISLENVNQSAPEETNYSDDGQASASSITTSLTTLTDGAWIISTVGSGNAITFTPQTGQTEVWDSIVGSQGGAGSYKNILTAGYEETTWNTDSGSNRLSQVVAAFAPALYQGTPGPTCDETPTSCSIVDIQAAVDAVNTAGGGTVCLPSCDVSLNDTNFHIPCGINIIGTGNDSTKLRDAVFSFNADFYGSVGDGVSRLSGISVINDFQTQNSYFTFRRCQGMRIDNSYFEGKFSTFANVNMPNTDTSNYLVDHCEFNLYTSYGFYVYGDNTYRENINSTDCINMLGKAEGSGGVFFVEDSAFTGFYDHLMDARTGTHYIFRHNTINYDSGSGPLEGHGPTEPGGDVGTNVIEIYDITIDQNESSSSAGILFRSGCGVVFNTIIRNKNYGIAMAVENSPYNWPRNASDYPVYHQPNDLWFWGNNYQNIAGGDVITVWNSEQAIQENRDYFLRAPNQVQDGFTYTPYTYPHPLVSG